MAFYQFINIKPLAQAYLKQLESLFGLEYLKRIHLVIKKIKNFIK
jgi:hypothetical protein